MIQVNRNLNDDVENLFLGFWINIDLLRVSKLICGGGDGDVGGGDNPEMASGINVRCDGDQTGEFLINGKVQVFAGVNGAGKR